MDNTKKQNTKNKRMRFLLCVLFILLCVWVVDSSNILKPKRISANQYNSLGHKANVANRKLEARRYWLKGLKQVKKEPNSQLVETKLHSNIAILYDNYFGNSNTC